MWLTDRRRLSRLLAALMVLVCFLMPAVPIHADEPPDEFVPGEIIVKLSPLANLPLLSSLYGLLATPLDRIDSLLIYRLKILDGVSPLVKALLLERNPLVVFAEPNYIGQTPEGRKRSLWAKGGNEEDYHAQWAPAMLRLSEAHTVARGAGVTVAVLDTGVDPDHPALAGHLVPGFDFVDLDADPREEGVYGQDAAYGHGTHVAGLIALAAPEARILPIRILKPDGTGNLWVLAEALRYAFTSGADVVNLSYSFRLPAPSRLISEILAGVTSVLPGPVIVAAAGNSGPSTSKEYPAAQGVPGVLAVAASTETDTLADFSTQGQWVDVAAPGEHILSSVPDNIYGTWSGTSMAAPLAAGTVALVRAAHPELRPAEVTERIITTAATIDGPVPHRVDAAAALGLPPAQPLPTEQRTAVVPTAAPPTPGTPPPVQPPSAPPRFIRLLPLVVQ